MKTPPAARAGSLLPLIQPPNGRSTGSVVLTATVPTSSSTVCLQPASLGFKHFFIVILLIVVATLVTVFVVQLNSFSGDVPLLRAHVPLRLLPPPHKPPTKLLRGTSHGSGAAETRRRPQCTYWSCFDVYRCGNTGHERISVYVYPLYEYVDEAGTSATAPMSNEYFAVLKAIVASKYYTANPHEACVLVPSLDTLSQNRLVTNLTSQALRSLPYWNNGQNHLLFNMVAGAAPDFSPVLDVSTGSAMIAGADFDTHSYRAGFDIPIPFYSSFAARCADGRPWRQQRRSRWLVVSTQIAVDAFYMQTLQELQMQYTDEFLILDACYMHNYSRRCDVNTQDEYEYAAVLQDATFCLLFRGERMGQRVLLEMMAANCIPVVVIDSPVLPFATIIDWKRAAIFVMEDYMHSLFEVLHRISPERIGEMRRQVRFLYARYFSSIAHIVETALDIVQDRVYPHWARAYDDWNVPPEIQISNPFFVPVTAPKAQGFTTVILTYDRVQSLYALVEKLSRVPSLMKILVVWNNQNKAPPPLLEFPAINKPIIVIRTTANKLSNRFIPYEEIETEAILTIDDDIIMLTSDELEFAFEVWREFPDRIVGFPSRTHVWDNVTNSWKYESEWTNQISMVLTGAAFHHKFWSYMYTHALPPGVKDWVDEHMNCEDIAMNFLVANITNKPPIKVAPRKKFKCPECVNNEMLSADMGHMVARSQCVDKFAQDFGRMPLISVEFRADPVLYKDPFPEKLKRFNDIGSL